MHARVRTRVVVTSALSLLLLTGMARHVAAVDLANDVDIVWSAGPLRTPCQPTATQGCTVQVSGAPRRLFPESESEEAKDSLRHDAERLTFRIVIEGTEFVSLAMEVTALDGNHQPVRRLADGLPMRFTKVVSLHGLSELVLELKDFDSFDALQDLSNDQARAGLILIVAGSFIEDNRSETTSAAITLSGPGTWIMVDGVGDFDGARAIEPTDTPPRSMEVARALVQLENAPAQTRGVDLDVARPRPRAVGLTHGLDLPGGSSIQNAMLRLRIRSDDPLNDVLLFDRGVRGAANGEPCVQAVALSDLLPESPVPGTSYELEINLANVPVMSNYPLRGEPCEPSRARFRDLVPTIANGRLNVIVVGRSTVDDSELTLGLRDP